MAGNRSNGHAFPIILYIFLFFFYFFVIQLGYDLLWDKIWELVIRVGGNYHTLTLSQKLVATKTYASIVVYG